MAGFKSLTTGAKAALLAGTAALAGLAAYGGYSLRQKPPLVQDVSAEAAAPAAVVPEVAPPATDTAAAPPTDAAAAQAADGEVADGGVEAPADPMADTATIDPSAASTPAAADDPASPSPIVPTFDVVRVEPDGTTVVAGKAEPGAKIVLRVDGAEISATSADDNGNFAAFFVLGSSSAPRLLTLSSILPDQTEVASTAEVALAPTTAPQVIAAAEPEAAPAPADVTAAAPAEPAPPAIPPAPEAPAALLITKDGVNLLQPGTQSADAADAAAAADLTIDTISYTSTGDVQLAGRAGRSATLRIYLDNAPLVDVQAAESGLWAATMPEIAPGIYTLRADQLAENGSVTARFETPFKRETQQALASAVAQTPDPAAPEAEPAPVVADAEVAVAEPAAADATDVAETAAAPTAEVVPGATETPATPDANAVASAPAAISVTVQPGFTLWGIASQQFGDGVMYVQVFEANKDKIRDPDLIYPGQVFVIPVGAD